MTGKTLVIALGLLLCLATFAEEEPAAEPAPELQPSGFHPDPKELLDAVAASARCLAREDTACVRKTLDRIEAQCDRMELDPDLPYDSTVRARDRAFHATLDRARELATIGKVPETFRQFVWVQQTCVLCHDASRAQGLGPEQPIVEKTE